MSFPTQSASGVASSSKVQIPRLPQKRREPPRKPTVSRQDRISRACSNCRTRKVRCDGGKPTCSNCRDNNATSCFYASARKDRLKTATSHNLDMSSLLRELRTRASDEEQSRIDHLLSAVADDITDAAAPAQQSPEKPDEADHGEDPGEANVSAEVGSSGDLDLVDEDLLSDKQTRATGFIGKASEIQWIRKLHTEGGNDKANGPYGPPGQDKEAAMERLAALRHRQKRNPSPLMHTSKASYYLDDDVLETDFMVEPSGMPPFETAERLVQAYMETCHNSFPFLAKKAFLSEFYHYYAALQRGNPYNPPQKWQATLNLVFAIGAVYSHLVSAEWRADERDHLMYYSRASALGLDDPWWFSHPDLPQMQITGLLSFYYLSIGRVNRAWVLIGLAMRFAYALGLHIRNEDRGAGVAKKEVLGRIWWAHFAFERFLSATMGRPSQGIDRSCSVPFPLPIASEEIEGSIIESKFGDQLKMSTGLLPRKPPTSSGQSPASSGRTDSTISVAESANSGTYLKAVVQLCEITQEALHLYGTSTVGQSWQSIQTTITSLNEELEVWATSLPKGLDFFQRSAVSVHRYKREQNTLNIYYHTTKISINRPCLCRLDRRIVNQTASSNDINERAASTCVASAKFIADLLPDEPERHIMSLYEIGPWWSMVHTIMQSLVVLLLEISLRGLHVAQDREEIIPSLKKLIRWLRAMRANNGVARRAYFIAFNLLKEMIPTISIDISDLLREDEEASEAMDTGNVTPLSEARDTQPLRPNIKTPEQRPQTLGNYVPIDANSYGRTFQYQQGDPIYQGTTDDTFMGQFTTSWDPSGSTFPGLFYTNFDEQNPLPGFGNENFVAGYEDGDLGPSYPS